MYNTLKQKYISLLKKFTVISVFVLLFGSLTSISVSAESQTQKDSKAFMEQCSVYLDNSGNLGFSDLFLPAKFIPLIPEECNSYGGKTQPLKLDLIPFIIARGYGFVSGLVLYFFSFMMVVYGVQWIFGGFSGDESILNVKRNFKNAVSAVIITITISVVIIELLEVIGYNVANIDSFLQ